MLPLTNPTNDVAKGGAKKRKSGGGRGAMTIKCGSNGNHHSVVRLKHPHRNGRPEDNHASDLREVTLKCHGHGRDEVMIQERYKLHRNHDANQ